MIYKDSSRTIPERVEDLLGRMTLKEKVGQMNQRMLGWNAFVIKEGEPEITQAYKDEVAFGDGLGALYGISRADGWNSHITMGISPEESVRTANALQKYAIEHTRLGIPVLMAAECPHGHEALEGTVFPTNIGIGSTWNPELYEKVCSVIAEELRARGGHLALVSTLDIATDPRWGRCEECYGEDPLLAARFSEKAVTGIQGRNASPLLPGSKAAVVLKHFCAQGATMGGHNGKSTNIGPRELREIHLSGMRSGAAAGAMG
ncbi:MAG: glycoside hydrolase family 3 N-terminal domain-containing protein, partial [Spirochaetales bacterium]|nr:glycoside hydrolase family 3 N-terminal domain-containing protein [Spirochaetales bacterium]